MWSIALRGAVAGVVAVEVSGGDGGCSKVGGGGDGGDRLVKLGMELDGEAEVGGVAGMVMGCVAGPGAEKVRGPESGHLGRCSRRGVVRGLTEVKERRG